MKVIRYSRAFKLQLVREVESGENCASQVGLKYGVRGPGTVLRWVRQFGSGRYGKVLRVERADEIRELSRLRQQLRQTKEALADAHLELALERAYLAEACEQMNQTVEGFKKKHGGRPRTGRGWRSRNSKW
jgi:transposase-like protein